MFFEDNRPAAPMLRAQAGKGEWISVNRKLAFVLAYACLIVFILLGMWLFIISREPFLRILGLLYVGDDPSRSSIARVIDKLFVLFSGCAWLVSIFAVEQYFKMGVEKNDLFRRVSRAIGIALLLAFLCDGTVLATNFFHPAYALQVPVVVVSLAAGAALTWVSCKPGAFQKRPANTESVQGH